MLAVNLKDGINLMMRYLIIILTLILFLFGLLVLFGSMYALGIGVYTPLLTISTLIGFISLLAKKNMGLFIMICVSICWLLRFFEHASFLALYDIQNTGRWILVLIPILLSSTILILAYKSYKNNKRKPCALKTPILLIITIAIIGLCSFIRKPNTKEFNCWYYFDNSTKDYRITFAITPEQIFETTTDSKELKEFVQKYGIKDEFRDGIYCPETKVRVITRFKKIVEVKVLGFRNTTTNYKATLNKPIEIDINNIHGDKEILQEPDFTLGD